MRFCADFVDFKDDYSCFCNNCLTITMRMSMRVAPSDNTIMAPTSGATGSGTPDMALIGELMEDISRNPPAIAARKLLVEHYAAVGWLDAALDDAKELKRLAPADSDVSKMLLLLEKKPEPPAYVAKVPVVISTAPVTEVREWDVRTGRYKKKSVPKSRKPSEATPAVSEVDLETGRKDLTQGYQLLRVRAKHVLADLLNLQALQKKAGLPQSRNTTRIEAIVQERKDNSPTKFGPPDSARSVARLVRDHPKTAIHLLVEDLEHTMNWIRAPHGKTSNADNDAVRDALVKRKNILRDALPDEQKIYCDHALMHMEHEHLERNYVNTETMLGDEVKDIPREDFYVTEDNYAWSMGASIPLLYPSMTYTNHHQTSSSKPSKRTAASSATPLAKKCLRPPT